MIVKCTSCQISFEFDDGVVIKRKGARVRCSRCGEWFTVKPPGTRPVESAEQKRLKFALEKKLLVSALILLTIALGFNALLTLSSLEKLYVESIVSKYSVIGKDLQRNIEKSLRFGKSITKFVGIEKVLNETKQNLIKKEEGENQSSAVMPPMEASDIAVSITLPNGGVLFSTDKNQKDKKIPDAVLQGLDPNASEKDSIIAHYAKFGSNYYIILPITGGFTKKEWAANAVIMFNDAQINALLRVVLNENIKTILIIAGIGFLLMVLLLNRIIRRSDIRKLPKRKIYLVMFLTVCISQIVFTGINTSKFRDYYLQISKEKTAVLANLLKDDIEYLISKGLSIDRLAKMDAKLGELIAATPELDNITITDSMGNPLYAATSGRVIDFQKADESEKEAFLRQIETVADPKYNLLLNIVKDEKVEGFISADSYRGFINTNISKQVLVEKLKEITLDSVTVLVISVLFFVELLILTFQFIKVQAVDASQKPKIDYRVIRPVAFMFLFGIDISISFLPLHMEQLFDPIFGLSKDIVMGLPISVEMLFAGAAIFIAGAWVDKRGWHEPFLIGLFLAALGVLYSWLSPNAVHFIMSRGFAGFGYGLALMAGQGFVISYTDEKNKAQGLAQFFAGVYAGSICGSAAGAMIADRIGYSPVFLVGSVVLFFVMFYSIAFMRSTFVKAAPQVDAFQPTAKPAGFQQTIRFFMNRNVLTLTLFSAFPGALAVVGFLNYFSPIYLNGIGTSQSNIGRVFMVYGICLIYFAPMISRAIDRSKNQKGYIVVTGVIGSLAFLGFYFHQGLWTVVFAVLMLGISGSVGNARRSYLLKLKASRELGAGKAMGLFNSASRLGQVVGPITIGWLVTVIGTSKGIVYFGLIYVIITVLFMISAQADTKISLQEGK